MNNAKRLLALALALGLVLCMCACGGSSEDKGTSETTTAATVPSVTHEEEKTEPSGDISASEEVTESTEEAALPTYTVTVVDESNNPLAGVALQMCLDTCRPGVTDANGVVTFDNIHISKWISVSVDLDGFVDGDLLRQLFS